MASGRPPEGLREPFLSDVGSILGAPGAPPARCFEHVSKHLCCSWLLVLVLCFRSSGWPSEEEREALLPESAGESRTKTQEATHRQAMALASSRGSFRAFRFMPAQV